MVGRFTRFIACSLTVIVAACGRDSPTAPSQASSITFFALNSNPGDQIGDGFRQRVGLSEGVFSASLVNYDSGSQGLVIGVRPAGGSLGWWWDLRLMLPPGQQIRPGTYENARRWPASAGQPGFELSGTGRGCSFLTARFVITDIAIGGPSGVYNSYLLDRLRMAFEQRCEGASASITGEVSIAANPWH